MNADAPGFRQVIVSSVGIDGKGTRTVADLSVSTAPEFFGLLLADAAHHIAAGMAEAGLTVGGVALTRVEILDRIKRTFRREMEQPSTTHRREKPHERTLQ